MVDNVELEAVLGRMEELAPAAKEYKKLEDVRDSMLPAGKDVMCGPYMVTWKRHEIHYKAKPARIGEQWRKKITKIEQ